MRMLPKRRRIQCFITISLFLLHSVASFLSYKSSPTRLRLNHRPTFSEITRNETLDATERLLQTRVGELDCEQLLSCMQVWSREMTLPAAQTLERLLFRLVQESQHRQSSQYLTLNLYIMVIKCWGQTQTRFGAERALELHTTLLQFHTPTVESYNAVLLAWSYHHDIQTSEAIFTQMQSVEPNALTVTALLDTYHRALGKNTYSVQERKQFVQRCERLSKLIRPTPSLVTQSLQRVYAKSGLRNSISKTEAILRSQSNPKTAHYNAVLTVYSRQPTKASAKKAVALLDAMGDQADTMSYALTILTCARRPDVELATQTLLRLETRAQLEYSHKEEYSRAAPVSVRLDRESFHHVLTCISKSGLTDGPERAMAIVHRMQAYAATLPALEPSVRTWNAVLHALGRTPRRRNKDPQTARRILQHLEDQHAAGVPHMQPNAFTYTGYVLRESDSLTDSILSIFQKEGLPEQADALLKEMETKYEQGLVDAPPDTFHYTIISNTWARSNSPQGPQRVLEILAHMMQRDQQGYPNVAPNTRTFNSVIDCLTRNGEVQSAEELLDYMINAFRNGNKVARPDAFTFNSIIYAYTKSEERAAGRSAEQILERFIEFQELDDKSVRPTVKSFHPIIGYYSNRREKDYPYRAEYILNRMVELYLDRKIDCHPSSFAIRSVMHAYAMSRHEDAGRNAERLLNIFTQLKKRCGETLALDKDVLNSVLLSWALSNDEAAGRNSEKYLDYMEREYNSGNTKLRPDSKSYSLALSSWIPAREPTKFRNAQAILERMEEQEKKGNKWVTVEDKQRAIVIKSCGFTQSAELADEALGVAVRVFDGMVESGTATSKAYAIFIRTCGRLWISSSKKEYHIRRAFEQCCLNDCADKIVLDRLRVSTSPELYQKLLEENDIERP